jgi:hypothetical protein
MNAFLAALAAPAAEGDMALYGWLAGSWALEVTEFFPEGGTRRRPGEWHFGWVLQGRALQDVWIVPAAAGGPAYYGTTLRIPLGIPAPEPGTWRILYADPGIKAQLVMTGRAEGKDIVQLGTDSAGTPRRWCFRDITPDRFRWTGEVSTGPDRWFTHIEFEARRLEPIPAGGG